MIPQLELRAKNSVVPSGRNVGEPSFAAPETTPGAKICGAGSPGSDAAVCAQATCGATVADPATTAMKITRRNKR